MRVMAKNLASNGVFKVAQFKAPLKFTKD